jgi:hypothetical protein
MSKILDPGKSARRAARDQAELLKKQKQKQRLELAEADSEVAAKKALALNPTKGRRSLINPSSGMRETLG